MKDSLGGSNSLPSRSLYSIVIQGTIMYRIEIKGFVSSTIYPMFGGNYTKRRGNAGLYSKAYAHILASKLMNDFYPVKNSTEVYVVKHTKTLRFKEEM